jgi:hypothetical protein
MVVARVAKQVERSRHDMDVFAFILDGLCNPDEMTASGREVDQNGDDLSRRYDPVKIGKKPIQSWPNVPPELWRQMTAESFYSYHRNPIFGYHTVDTRDRPVERYFTDVRIPSKHVDGWLSRHARRYKPSTMKVTEWLRGLAESGKLFEPDLETQKVSEKKHWWLMAQNNKFPGLSERQFERVWSTVAEEFPQMSKPGAKKKSPRKSSQ